jgi:uncharacterized membrane protein
MSNSWTRSMAFPFHALSIVAMLGCDWFIYIGNMLTHMDAVTAWVVTGSLSACLLTALAERDVARASWTATTLRALGAGVLVAAPLPLLGTLLAAVAALWALGSLRLRGAAPRPGDNARA